MTTRKFKVFIDPGHFAKQNRSPAEPTYYEGDWTYEFSKLLAAALRALGIDVSSTYDLSDVNSRKNDIEVFKRGQMSKGYDLFISLHTNAACNWDEYLGNPTKYDTADRACVIYQVNASGLEKELASNIAFEVNQILGCKQQYQIFDRPGSNGDWYGVLRGSASVGTPGIIVEHGFHTSKRCVEKIVDPSVMISMATTEAEHIKSYLEKKYPSSSDDELVCPCCGARYKLIKEV